MKGINALHELEINHLLLEQQFLGYIALHRPKSYDETKSWLRSLESFSVLERTLYISEVSQVLLNSSEKSYEKEWANLKAELQKENISKTTTSIIEYHLPNLMKSL